MNYLLVPRYIFCRHKRRFTEYFRTAISHGFSSIKMNIQTTWYAELHITHFENTRTSSQSTKFRAGARHGVYFTFKSDICKDFRSR
jgi:hypothetical protein